LSIVFSILLHGLLIGSLLIFIGTLGLTAIATADKLERALRISAVFAGAMVSLGAQASGVDYATFTVNALAGARPASAAAHFVATVIPALMGSAIGFYMARTMRRNEVMAVRIMGFVGMLATTAFLQVYAEAASRNGFKLGAAALPNVAFTAGVILTVVFTLKTGEVAGTPGHSLPGMVAKLLLQQHQARGGAPTPSPDSSAGFAPERKPFQGL